jgi:uncharacterized protein (TIGR01777 family)
MRILISGASGFIGSSVSAYLASQEHEVIRLVRHTAGPGEVSWDPEAGTIDAEGLEGFDGVVHLASMPWNGRWTPQFKQRLRANRLGTNGLLAKTLAACQRKPRVFVCASGMGIYPPSGDQVLSEDSAPGSDFAAQLQRDGEAATAPASAAGIRVVALRIPMVLGGTIIQRVTGRMGNGRQWWSWVALGEMGSIVQHILANDSLWGPVNTTSPNPMRNADFAAILCHVLGRRPGVPIPAFALRLMLGEMADTLILASRRIEPRKLLASGYQFHYPELGEALRHELAQTA